MDDLTRTESDSMGFQQDEVRDKQIATARYQTSMVLPHSIHKMRLEAIFHPKFENENRTDKAVRREMIERVEKQQGYLEVTLKHSGSLVLWSGHTRFYSKNSLDNQYTYAAEILVRSHMERAWRGGQQAGDRKTKYDECSQFLKENRLTLSFEVVTAVLGDHGDRPRKDFVMLTAVADRSRERFYSTAEVIELAQRFRLPHNDTWIFGLSSADSVKRLFAWYDSSRETGKARDTVEALSDAADVTVSSMYQHEEFQGDILEGVIIRYVLYRQNQSADDARRLMGRLSSESITILKEVPADLPFSFELNCECEERSSLFGSSLRQISKACGGFSTSDNGENTFQDTLYQVLSTGFPRSSFVKHPDKSIDLPAMTKHLTTVRDDIETSRIARMLQRVESLHKPVSYVLVEEESPDGKSRWLCIIHVHNDETFRQYHFKKNDGEMNLFRGFCIEINGSNTNELGIDHTREDDVQHAPDRSTDDFLMLKMKFLPYMTRTFLCRNNLRLIEKDGPFKFYRLIESMLNKWAISVENKKKLIPFLQSWAVFAHLALTTTKGGGKRLSQSNYLDYLAEFSKLYKEGKAPKPIKLNYEGTVIVVSPLQDDAERAARVVAQRLEVKAVPVAPDTLEPGNICYCSIFNSVSKNTKRKFGQVSDTLSIVFLAFGEEDLNLRVTEERDRGKALGFSKSWRNYDCAEQIFLRLKDIPRSAEEDNSSEEFKSCICQLKSVVERKTDEKSRGVLVFFPGLPGCGKSTIVKSVGENLRRANGVISEDGAPTSRKVHVLERDAVGKSFWSQLRKMRRTDSRCVMVADKNAPPNALKLIGLNCYDTNGIPIAVIPDNSALQTTHIKGTVFPDGEESPDTAHFYPFSLSYLAVCMCRVLQRPPKSHRGKLDQSTPNACMILILFFSLYRSISAEAFIDSIDSKVASGGAVLSSSPIVLPFLHNVTAPPLPDDLRSELIAAIQLQVSGRVAYVALHSKFANFFSTQRGYDIRKKKPKATDSAISRMEKRLRDSIEKYRTLLSQLTVDTADTERSFVEQLADKVHTLDSGTKEEQFLKLASVDLEKKRIHQILIDNSSNSSMAFLKMALQGSLDDCAIQGGCYADSQFVARPHITLIHHNDFDQTQMMEKFAHLQGCFVNVSVRAFLWNDKVAAFAVDVEETSADGQPLLRSQNTFVHVTVWFATGAKAFMANELPNLVAQNKAHRVDFAEPITLQGNLTFWDMANTPIVV
ncbi:MAG: hypothetical protein SGBAC_006771 [Bacillariaceae sp.]